MRLLACLLLLATSAIGQTMSSDALVHTLYSENGQFYLKSIPHDNDDYTVIGTTYVYKVGEQNALYSVDRSFDFFGYPNKTNLSNDGRTIFYINDIFGNNEVDQQKLITVYIDGELIKKYSLPDLSDCDNDYQDCFLLYRNEEVINRDSSKWDEYAIIPGIKKGTSEIEKFANINNVFSSGDTLYLIDQFRQLNRFDLTNGNFMSSTDLESAYASVKNLVRTNEVEIEYFKIPPRFNLPSLKNGQSFSGALSSHLDMVAMKFYGEEFNAYKGYVLDIEVLIGINGETQIMTLEPEVGLPEEKIRAFLSNQHWDLTNLPAPLEKWRFEEILLLRKSSKVLAEKEKKEERQKFKEAYLKRLVADSINGFYIPRNLGECMIHLDLLLRPKDREAIKSSDGKISLFHNSLGRDLRNNWGLWGGSRLQKYFYDRQPFHPDDMSVIILKHYYDWLNGKTNTWKLWEQDNPIIRK
jgi:hypothetical protein